MSFFYFYRMRIVRRTISVNHQEYEIFLGVKKVVYNTVTVFNIHFFPEDPNKSKCRATLIKNGFKSEREAISYGKRHVKQIYITSLNK